MNDYEKFISENSWKYKTEEELKAGFDRLWKCKHDILLSKEEFIIEAGEHYRETAGDVYEILVGYVNENKLTNRDVYYYAAHSWCMCKPEAIIAYETGPGTGPRAWSVNTCSDEITDEKALDYINREWGFEISRIELLGKAYYCATDYMFIRFDCGHMTWLWTNGTLFQVYH